MRIQLIKIFAELETKEHLTMKEDDLYHTLMDELTEEELDLGFSAAEENDSNST